MKVYETMTKLRFPKYAVRVWRNCSPTEMSGIVDDFRMGPDLKIVEVGRLIEEDRVQSDPSEIARRLFNVPRVEAIEILDPEGNGGILYPDWK